MASERIVLVCGGRDFSDRDELFSSLDALHRFHPITRIVHGAARGADSLAGEWARSRGVEESAYPADWRAHGRAAGPIRNRRMVHEARPDLIVSFPGGAGTADMLGLAATLRIPVVFGSESTPPRAGEPEVDRGGR